MHGNGERDPLDGWLSQQVQPLPPPPGTFELITRRARRRKLRKLAVTVTTAAAVAAGVALAVPGGLLLSVSPSQVTGRSVAAGQTSPTVRGTHSANGTGTHVQTPTASIGPSASSPGGFTEPAGPVPPNFQPSSVTYVSKNLGWVIGQAGTPGHCQDANPYYCTSIVRTDNAGKTWKGGPAPKTGPPVGATGVSGIRFLDGINGWAYGPELWATHDAGNTWHQLPTNGQLVIALEAAGDRAFAVWASCPPQRAGININIGMDLSCTSYTLMSAQAGSDAWQPVSTYTTGLTPVASGDASVKIALSSSAGYLYLVTPGSTTLYSGALDRTWKKVATLPCEGAVDGLALAGSTHLSAVCIGKTPTLLQSSDGGLTWTKPAVTWPAPAPVQPTGKTEWDIWSLTAAPNGTLVMATSSGLYVLPAGSTQWKLTNATGKAAPQGGFSYVGMTTDDQGVAVLADFNVPEIWMTFNGGQTWAPRTPITPGN